MSHTCGCCIGVHLATPQTLYNRPGLNALQYRVGTYATFFETMLARLHSLPVAAQPDSGVTSLLYPLKGLTTRELDDPAIALLDAWAVIADILSFYQERVANEGYLLTATERRSVLELARLIGYKLRPGVAASVYLAFSVIDGFEGVLPAGTRAQSVPGAGQTAQFFEIEDPLPSRAGWNALNPRLTRPQIITPPPTTPGVANHLGTNADLVDALFLKGVATNLKTGDALLVSFGDAPDQHYLRIVEEVDIQGDASRTRIVLQRTPAADLTLVDILTRFVEDAATSFEGSDLAGQAADLLQPLLDQEKTGLLTPLTIASSVPPLRILQAMATKRGFARLEPWFRHLTQTLGDLSSGASFSRQAVAANATTTRIQPAITNYATSSLSQLDLLLDPLSKPVSVQPRNALALGRSVASTFTAQSDTVPRLLNTLRRVPGRGIYNAWGSAEPNPIELEIFALRSKSALFASSYVGAATFVKVPGTHGGGFTQFAAPNLNNAWGQLLPKSDQIAGVPPPSFSVLALDTVNDKIQPGSWIAIERPDIELAADAGALKRSFHRVAAARSIALDTTTGFSARSTVLDLETPWLQASGAQTMATFFGSTLLLRGTVVYTQAEPVDLAEEPLDRDVEGSSVELDGLYDGLEAGKWVIVTGTRTDLPNVTGASASELVMISGVTQGKGKSSCRPFLLKQVPFRQLLYISDANAAGDRLVVGRPAPGLKDLLDQVGNPDFPNQEFCEHVQLCPGLYADAYVPTSAERSGNFSPFAAQLIDPDSNPPGSTFRNGVLPQNPAIFAWRIRNIASGAETVHTTLEFANALSYTYDSTSVAVMANVARATHGQLTGEVLGDGDAAQAFQTFALRQTPLTYVPADTPNGTASTLQVTVNEIQWDEAVDFSELRPNDRAYTTLTDDNGKVQMIFGDGEHGVRVPTGNSNIKGTYRYGIGKPGNVDAGSITQMATHPLGSKDVTNPLEASGGADPDSRDQARRNAPTAVLALDRLVSVQDYADFARTFAGIAKTSSILISDGRRQLVHLTIAGADDMRIDQSSDLYRNLVAASAKYGDFFQPVQVRVRRVKLLVISAAIHLQPGYSWDAVAPLIRSALLDLFSFDARELGQPAFPSEAIAAMQGVEGVSYANLQIFDAVAEDTTVKQLAALAGTLAPQPFVSASRAYLDPAAPGDADACTRIKAAELIFLTPDLPETLILTQIQI
jgi:hypothetical protein